MTDDHISEGGKMHPVFQTGLGKIFHSDSLDVMKNLSNDSVDLVVTSPPFGLLRKKEYGNADASDYLNWFKPFAKEIFRILKDSGSFVIDIGGAWNPQVPTRSLYHFKLMIMLCEEFGFHLAQEFYWWNPSKLPSPAEWVNIRRIRVKDSINTVWWLSKTPWPKASNTRVLQPYSDSMRSLFENGYTPKDRPSVHRISDKFTTDNGAAIPPNLLAIANTESNGNYTRYCQKNGIKVHPARFPHVLPEYFIRMLTDKDDIVIDPFAGSCMTGEVAEKLMRKWICSETIKEYIDGAIGRFVSDGPKSLNGSKVYYRIPHPGYLWNGHNEKLLPPDGGKKRGRTLPINKGE